MNIGYAAEYYKTGLTGNQSIGGLGSGTSYKYAFTLNFLNFITTDRLTF